MNLIEIKVEDFGFDAEFFLDDNSNEQQIQYPGMTGTITLKRKSDIKVEKSSEQKGYVLYTSDGKPYIHFEVTVSTEKGTAGKTLSIKDTIAHTAIKGDYNESSFKLQKAKAQQRICSFRQDSLCLEKIIKVMRRRPLQ